MTDNTIQFSIPCTLEQKRKIEALAITRGMTVTEFIIWLVDQDFKAYQDEQVKKK